MRTQFLADENLRRAIVLGVRRREPGVSFVEAVQAGTVGKQDPAVLRIAARENRILVSKEVVAWQLGQAMKKKRISKSRMAALLKTSRTQVDRLLDPKNDITLSSLQRAAALLGRRVIVELV